MSKILAMNCDMNNGTKKVYDLSEPKSNLTLAQINAAFDVALQKDFFKIGNVKPVSLISAQYVETIRTDIVE